MNLFIFYHKFRGLGKRPKALLSKKSLLSIGDKKEYKSFYILFTFL